MHTVTSNCCYLRISYPCTSIDGLFAQVVDKAVELHVCSPSTEKNVLSYGFSRASFLSKAVVCTHPAAFVASSNFDDLPDRVQSGQAACLWFVPIPTRPPKP